MTTSACICIAAVCIPHAHRTPTARTPSLLHRGAHIAPACVRWVVGMLYVGYNGEQSFSWSNCNIQTTNNNAKTGIPGGIPINLFTWVGYAFDPAKNELNGYYCQAHGHLRRRADASG